MALPWPYIFNSRDGESVGHFTEKFRAIPWFYYYKWEDYWPFLEFIYLYFLWPNVVMCFAMGYFFHVWGGVGVGHFFSFCDKYLY